MGVPARAPNIQRGGLSLCPPPVDVSAMDADELAELERADLRKSIGELHAHVARFPSGHWLRRYYEERLEVVTRLALAKGAIPERRSRGR